MLWFFFFPLNIFILLPRNNAKFRIFRSFLCYYWINHTVPLSQEAVLADTLCMGGLASFPQQFTQRVVCRVFVSLCCSQGRKGHFKLSACSTRLGQRVGVSMCLVSWRFVPVESVAPVDVVFLCSLRWTTRNKSPSMAVCCSSVLCLEERCVCHWWAWRNQQGVCKTSLPVCLKNNLNFLKVLCGRHTECCQWSRRLRVT